MEINSSKILEFRKKNSLSQAEFSKIIGVKKNTIYRWEKGLYTPSFKYEKKLNILFGDKNSDQNNEKLYVKTPLNYTGNKYRILEQILPFFPSDIDVFVDLFCGGATVGTNVNAKTVYFIDNNERVISLLKFIANSNYDNLLRNLVSKIKKYNLSFSGNDGYSFYFKSAIPANKNNGLKQYNLNGFKSMRDDYNLIKNKDSDEANELLYLLLVYGFNNDLRFNSKGEYNLPCGKTDLNKNNLKKLFDFIKIAHEKEFYFICGDFRDNRIREICFNADFIYMDPPYLITDAVYNENNMRNEKKEEELISFISELKKKRVPFCLSNVLEKNNGAIYNKPLVNFISDNNNLKVIDIKYHYRGASYHKKNRDSKEREIIVLSDYENK